MQSDTGDSSRSVTTRTVFGDSISIYDIQSAGVDASLPAMGSPSKAMVAFTDVVKKDAEDGQEATGAK